MSFWDLFFCSFFAFFTIYSSLSKNGSTLRTFLRSDLVPHVTLIVPFVWTTMIFHCYFVYDSLFCGLYHLSVLILFHQLRNHNQLVFDFQGLCFDQFGFAYSLLFFSVSYEGYIEQHVPSKKCCTWWGF